ncbi:hypothetical protein TrLO_g12621 [Triparma laevis f. longispina]|uniref:UFSP1/2/DUB catalytic domain-containing protein n=1 Tax=Triparma laevis f. longispina TaxID=1714387 RepID=A0A9W7EGF6_9STRA|nr:hypothetical protein TrLO_g12621 [Triparma laevis f. longispina]
MAQVLQTDEFLIEGGSPLSSTAPAPLPGTTFPSFGAGGRQSIAILLLVLLAWVGFTELPRGPFSHAPAALLQPRSIRSPTPAPSSIPTQYQSQQLPPFHPVTFNDQSPLPPHDLNCDEVVSLNGTGYYYYSVQVPNSTFLDDYGWGCAYRAFQTILHSLNPTVAPPSILNIQQRLVDLGVWSISAIGSKTWMDPYIGAEYLRGASRPVFVDMFKESNHTLLKRHLQFALRGIRTPIMIDDGLKAFSVAGACIVDGELFSLLRLDPHIHEAQTTDYHPGMQWLPFDEVFASRVDGWTIMFPTSAETH